VRAPPETVEEAVVVVDEEDDVEAVREVDGGDGESADTAGFVVTALVDRNRKHMAGRLGFPRLSDGELGTGAGLGAAAGSGSGGAIGSLVERSKSTSMMWPLSCIITFSGFRSRYTMPMLCRYSRASTNSAA
jgi:hypothetical protein